MQTDSDPPKMAITPEIDAHDNRRTDLNRLLVRLDAEPANAWEKYRNLHRRLVKFFECNQCSFPEDLADEVLDRVARKPEAEQVRDVTEFVIGVARNVRFEAFKKRQRESYIEERPGGQESLPDPRNHEQDIVAELDQRSRLACLRECMGKLKPADRELALEYYSAQDEKQKLHRQKLASAIGVTMIALRVRTNRLREKLEQCVSNCLEARRLQAKETAHSP